MMVISFWPILILALVVALFVWPTIRILHKSGRSGWWVLLWFVPVANIVMYWVFSFVRWPKVDDAPEPDVNAF
jgi:uncharacterized membrane protein YhaH (DUF805 family)